MAALVIDLGPDGVGVEHQKKLASNEVYTVRIDWRQSFQSKARVRHSELRKLADQSGPSVFRTGLTFVGLAESASVVIDSILIDEVKRQVAEWEANLTGTRRDRLPNPGFGQTSPSASVAFVWHRIVSGRWVTVTTKDPNQPIDGFAVCDDESPRQVDLLRRAYETYDDDDRDMLRMMAHLAIANRTKI